VKAQLARKLNMSEAIAGQRLIVVTRPAPVRTRAIVFSAAEGGRQRPQTA
jgi:hypothetical protein